MNGKFLTKLVLMNLLFLGTSYLRSLLFGIPYKWWISMGLATGFYLALNWTWRKGRHSRK